MTLLCGFYLFGFCLFFFLLRLLFLYLGTLDNLLT